MHWHTYLCNVMEGGVNGKSKERGRADGCRGMGGSQSAHAEGLGIQRWQSGHSCPGSLSQEGGEISTQ